MSRINEDRIQRQFLTEVNLTFDNTQIIAQAMEMASKNKQDWKVRLAVPCDGALGTNW